MKKIAMVLFCLALLCSCNSDERDKPQTLLQERAFYSAIYGNEVDNVKQMLIEGADPNYCYGEARWHDSNPLVIVAQGLYTTYSRQSGGLIPNPTPDVEVLRLLVEAGADVNRRPYVWNRVYMYNNGDLQGIPRQREADGKDYIHEGTLEEEENMYLADANRILKAFLQAGADPDKLGHPYPYTRDALRITDEEANEYFAQGTKPIHEAIKKGMKWESQVDLLLQYTRLDEKSLEAAKESGDANMIEKINRLWATNEKGFTGIIIPLITNQKSDAEINIARIEESMVNFENYIQKHKTEQRSDSLKIGDIGSGGGIIFYVEGNKYFECMLLGSASWQDAFTLVKNYRGGGHDNWYLPTQEELDYIYENLRKKDVITGDGWHWSSSKYVFGHVWSQRFSIGNISTTDRTSDRYGVFAIRIGIMHKKTESDLNPTTYEIGDIGPGGGIIFSREGTTYLECSELLGEGQWDEVLTLVENYRGGGYADWYIPTIGELNDIYVNLRVNGFIAGEKALWTSTHYESDILHTQGFQDGLQSRQYKSNTAYVRAVRSFSSP